MHDLFNKEKEELSKYDILQLEDWIRRCRNAIKIEDYNTNNPVEDYKKAVLQFCDEWKKHYKENKDIYKSENFKKAILANGKLLNRVVLILKYGRKKKEVDITDRLYNALLNNEDLGVLNNLMAEFKDKRLNDIGEYFELVQSLKDAKDFPDQILNLIEGKVNYNIDYCVVEVLDDSIFEINDIEKLIEAVTNSKDVILNEEYIEPSKRKEPLLKSLEGFDIAKQQYYNFKDFLNIEFEKKFFINLCFYLSLDSDAFEIILNLYGFTIEDSKQDRDRIIHEFVACGFSKEYIEKSIEANNLKLLKLREFPNRSRDISLINDFSKRELNDKEKKEFLYTLEYAINRLESFVAKKEESRVKKQVKYNKYSQRLNNTIIAHRKASDDFEIFESNNYERIKELKDLISNTNKEISIKIKARAYSTPTEIAKLNKEITELKTKKQLYGVELTKLENDLSSLEKNKNELLRAIRYDEKVVEKHKTDLENFDNKKHESILILKTYINDYDNLTIPEINHKIKELKDLHKKHF